MSGNCISRYGNPLLHFSLVFRHARDCSSENVQVGSASFVSDQRRCAFRVPESGHFLRRSYGYGCALRMVHSMCELRQVALR